MKESTAVLNFETFCENSPSLATTKVNEYFTEHNITKSQIRQIEVSTGRFCTVTVWYIK